MDENRVVLQGGFPEWFYVLIAAEEQLLMQTAK
jgi:hypothetical protein